jgi:sporulation protein YlmC with PRC-barrel domain
MRRRNLDRGLTFAGLVVATMTLSAQPANRVSPAYGPPQPGHSVPSSQGAEPGRSGAGPPELKVSSILGLPVRSEAGEPLGRVQDLIVSVDSRAVSFAIVQYGGTLGIGETRVAVPMQDLRWSPGRSELILAASRRQFEAASSVPTGAWASVAGEDWVQHIDRFYGHPSATGQSRYERQQVLDLGEGREPVRASVVREVWEPPKTPPRAANTNVNESVTQLTDEDLMAQINGLVRRYLGDRADGVQVTLTEGVVTLTGRIATQAQQRLLEVQIKALPGVRRVQDVLITGY